MPAESPRSPDRGFALFISTLALVISMGALLAVAFKLNDTNSSSTASMPMASSMPGSMPMSSSAQAAVENVKLVVKSDEEHAKMGSDGSWHDAFLPADFSIKPGSLVRVTVYNYDDAEHTFTSNSLGTNATIAGGSESEPAVTTFTFRAPEKAGRYGWLCALPCDPWAMSHDGFMRGFVTVT
ncbi:MAG TPA: cupredoxin domain-containing protein [Solirubrobacterales bacterium]|nr:cupredoxin domain-containing protein [Solirubrobacterales bacterium]